jgi:hypothetical protein
VAGGFVLLLCLGIGAFVVLPALSGDEKNAAGAKAAAQHGIDLVRSGDYNGFYDLFDSTSRATISRSDFVTLATCIKLADTVVKYHLTVGSATVIGNTARVETASDTGRNHLDLRWEDSHWRFHYTGNSGSSGTNSSDPQALCGK